MVREETDPNGIAVDSEDMTVEGKRLSDRNMSIINVCVLCRVGGSQHERCFFGRCLSE